MLTIVLLSCQDGQEGCARCSLPFVGHFKVNQRAALRACLPTTSFVQVILMLGNELEDFPSAEGQAPELPRKLCFPGIFLHVRRGD